jgi:RimJ/RimL family protein N-acetyltransferase
MNANEHDHEPASRAALVLRTERLVLRPWRPSDAAAFADINADASVMEFYPRTLSRDESEALAQRIQAVIVRDGFGLWAVELPQEREFIGYIGLQMVPFSAHFTPALEIGWRLAHDQWGRGLATEGARAALDVAHHQLGYAEVVAMTSVRNRRSQRVMQKLGMIYDPRDDFDVPVLPAGHPLRPHVLYRHRKAPSSG